MLLKSQVRYIQSLGQKKVRDAEGTFVAEGPKLIMELLKMANLEPVYFFATKQYIEDAPRAQLPVPGNREEVSEKELARISFLTAPKQVLAVFKKPSFTHPDLSKHVVLALDSISDPGNMGTLVRTADWFGIKQVLCTADSADVYNPKTVQATMGSIGRVEVLYIDLVESIKARGKIPVYAATLDGENIYGMPRIDEGIIVIGNESRGISESLLSLVTRKVTIPGSGSAESLNAAVAGGIILSHLV